ncbi:MAG: glycosyltransferase family 4 protein [SAR324 cluster bacterium]|nr:glycosyltransferase family 4 protein [SAR324 cluster bacterium]
MKIICNISKNIYPIEIQNHQQNMETFEGWLRYFDKIILIVQSPDSHYHHIHHKQIEAYLLPLYQNRILNYIMFILRGTWIGFSIRKEVSLWDGSEATSGGVIGVVLKYISGKPFMVELMGQNFNLSHHEIGWLRWLFLKPIVLLACSVADAIRCVSENIKQDAARYSWLRSKLNVVPSRVNTKTFFPEHYQMHRKSIRQEMALTENDLLLISIGRLVPFKGLKYFIDAMPAIVEVCPNVKWLIVGEGSLRNELENQVNALSLDRHVVFYGSVSFDKVPIMFAAADISILPSTDEGMTRAVLEAMAMNLPVVCSKVGGLLDVIRHDDNGIFFESRNSKDMADKVIRVCKDSKLRQRLAKSARNDIEKYYEYEISIGKFIELFKKLV